MKAKEKAEEMVAIYLNAYAFHTNDSAIYVVKKATEFAIICVEEIIKSYPHGYSINDRLYWGTHNKCSFWEEVKEELNKMK